MKRGRVAVTLAVGMAAACTPYETPPPPTTPPVAAALPPPVTGQKPLTTTTTTTASGPAGAGFRLEALGENGLPDPTALTRLSSAKNQIENCHPGTSGKLNIHIVRQKSGAIHLSVEPGASLSPAEQHCVLEALSTVDLVQTGGNVGGPTVPPSGFTSHIAVTW